MKVTLSEAVEIRGEMQPKGAQVDVRDPSGRWLIARKKATEVKAEASSQSSKPAGGKSKSTTGNKE